MVELKVQVKASLILMAGLRPRVGSRLIDVAASTIKKTVRSFMLHIGFLSNNSIESANELTKKNNNDGGRDVRCY